MDSFGKGHSTNSEEYIAHWFAIAENIHDEFDKDGLTSTAKFVRDYIDDTESYFNRKGKMPW